VDVNGKEYFVMDATFNRNAVVEQSRDIPQSARMIVRLPKHGK
jgi:hypothetical protein